LEPVLLAELLLAKLLLAELPLAFELCLAFELSRLVLAR
jgi:hypothetical protein